MTNLPDQHHINAIRKRLWCGSEYGQASVMIGAGFSLNANKRVMDSPDFPLWGTLGRKIYEDLYPGQSTQQTNALSLAAEYEASFGREALDRFLQETIPNNQHSPGKLHKLLMDLPWSDVYTTNYDTLLERTIPSIHDRKYDIVYTPADIPRTQQPRIVKLHGSFPSHQPFIITDEDYRTYPHRFAPFVNMVQQSIMENIFCLIGFSGEDPNFLNWIGWVKDNLGESMPTIYLCGFFDDFSEGKKQVFRQKQIITIDLSPLFKEADFGNERHAKGLEWFLLNLMYGEPEDISQWNIVPENPRPKSIEWKKEASDDLPDIPDTPGSNYTPSHSFNFFRQTPEKKSQQLTTIYKKWKKEREIYPGWVICPTKNRTVLWRNTKKWINPIVQESKILQNPQTLLLLYELNWRLDKILICLWEEWLNPIKEIISLFNPFPKYLPIKDKEINPNDNPEINWIEIQEAWIELVFVIFRYSRENHNKDDFNKWKKLLEKIVHLKSEWKQRWYYEQCLFHLTRLEINSVQQILDEWIPCEYFSFCTVKRAAIMAEMGDEKGAIKDVEDALNSLRSMLSLDKTNYNYSILSQESYTLFFLEQLKKIDYFNNYSSEKELPEIDDIIQINRGRFEKLALYQCNPKQELSKLSLQLDKERPLPQPSEKTKQDFYPGHIVKHYNFGGESYLEKLLPAFQIIRLFEEIGIPVRCGYSAFYPNEIAKACQWIAPFSPLYTLGNIFRINQEKYLKEWLDFVRVISLSEADVNYLYETNFSSLKMFQ